MAGGLTIAAVTLAGCAAGKEVPVNGGIMAVGSVEEKPTQQYNYTLNAWMTDKHVSVSLLRTFNPFDHNKFILSRLFCLSESWRTLAVLVS